MSVGWYILVDREPIAVSVDVWTEWRAGGFERCRVALTEDLPNGAYVSTVFLGLDHGHGISTAPVLFESMVFGGPHSQWCDRHGTWSEALAGHNLIVAALREGRDPGEVIS